VPHCRKFSPRVTADAKPLRALLPGREASPDFSGAGPTLTLDGSSPEAPLTNAKLHRNCAAVASPPSAVSTTKGQQDVCVSSFRCRTRKPRPSQSTLGREPELPFPLPWRRAEAVRSKPSRWRRKTSCRSIWIERSRLEQRIPLRFIKILPLI
jgi:hypothetical protein